MKLRIVAILIAAALMLSSLGIMAGCGKNSENVVPVQAVSMIIGKGNTGVIDREAGIVVSSKTIEIYKSPTQKVVELNVKTGDEVERGDVLFSYDEEALKLEYEKLLLQKEQYDNLIKTINDKIKELQKSSGKGDEAAKLENSVQLQTAQIELKEAEYTLAGMDDQIAEAKELLSNADYESAVDGRIKSVNESGTDSNGNSAPYITIVETGAFRVKGTVSELNLYSIEVGESVVVRSRFDSEQVWHGTVSEIELDSPEDSSQQSYGYYDGMDQSASASKYPFYIELDDADGLILGQHVYIEKDVGQCDEHEGIWLPAYFINDIDSNPYIWKCGNRNRLTMAYVQLGEYDSDSDSYEIVSGITEEDYIAFTDVNCAEGAKVEKIDDSVFSGDYSEFGISGSDVYDEYYDEYSEDGYSEGGIDVNEYSDQYFGDHYALGTDEDILADGEEVMG